MKTRGLVITGRPGSGKTTLFNALIGEARSRGLSIAGFSCPEVRVAGRRTGFKIRDLATGSEAWLARVDGCLDGPRVGRYHVCVEEALSVGLKALDRHADLLGIDELGPMELRIPLLRRRMIEALRDASRFIVVAHARLSDRDVLGILRAADIRWITVGPWRREEAWRKGFELLGELLGE